MKGGFLFLGIPGKTIHLNTMKISRLPLLSGLVCLMAFGTIRSHAQQIIETEPLTPFTILNTDGPIRIELIPAEENRMQIMLWGIDAKGIDWRIKDNALNVATRKGLVNKRAYADIKLYYRELNRIVITGGEVTAKDPILCSSLYLEAESSVGKMDIVAECNDVTVRTSGDNVVKVSGTAEYATYQARLGSRIECLDLSVGNVTASASGKAEIQLRANELLDARAVTGANIFFTGEPMTLHIKKATMGGVESINNL